MDKHITQLIPTHSCFLAPLSGFSDLPFRKITRECGKEKLTFTEMISADSLVRNKRTKSADKEDGEITIAQLFGSEPDIIQEAAKIIEDKGYAAVDVNMGCPVRKITKKGAGAALLQEPAKVGKIVEGMKTAVSIPVSIKIRSGWDHEHHNFLEIGKIAENAGAAFISLHPRTREKRFGRDVTWDHIRMLKDHVSIPVIGSGDVRNVADVHKMLNDTGCHAVIIGRRAIGNPWFFRMWNDKDYTVTKKDELETILRHLNYSVSFYGEELGLLKFRKHLVQYSWDKTNAKSFRKTVFTKNTLKDVENLIRNFFRSYEN